MYDCSSKADIYSKMQCSWNIWMKIFRVIVQRHFLQGIWLVFLDVIWKLLHFSTDSRSDIILYSVK